ncbi:MAG: orotate phosphoribosyltransferase [Eubacterium sp.]|jgi:orotate phosphoribosyltransferase|nr:orotate phosphoribosyltransferase [Eubacterium sp.]
MTYKEKFIKFMSDSGALLFGDFTLKSGRISPYFINVGNYNNGAEISKLGRFYAECILDNKIEFDTVFGPSYKGIPLCVSTVIALNNYFDLKASYCFNRKEGKSHGEGGIFVGKPPSGSDKVVVIDDVSTSGKALREVLPLLKNVQVTGFVITVDRMEKSLNSEKSAAEQIYSEFKIPVYSIINMDDIVSAIENEAIPGKNYLTSMKEYRKIYGTGNAL